MLSSDYISAEADYSKNKNFSDTTEIRRFMNKSEKDQMSPPAGFDTVSRIVELMSQLRFSAEEQFETYRDEVKNKRRELPIDWPAIIDIFISGNKNDEPPQEVISMIAEQFLPRLQLLLGSIKSRLQRVREFVPLSRAQQIDIQGMRWLSRQSGHTMAEKAGNRQRVLAVVRHETKNTLENRVLKEFFRKCAFYSDGYLRKYDRPGLNSKRIEAVRSLRKLSAEAMNSAIFMEIPRLITLPQPNYVLQYDPLYSGMWNWYLRLVRNAKMVESVWPYRNQLINEFLQLGLLAHIYKDSLFKPIFKWDIMINYFPTKGKFLTTTTYSNLFSSKILRMLQIKKRQDKSFLEFIVHTQKNKDKNLPKTGVLFYYVMDMKDELSQMFPPGMIVLFYDTVLLPSLSTKERIIQSSDEKDILITISEAYAVLLKWIIKK